jgi:hypothetical protein
VQGRYLKAEFGSNGVSVILDKCIWKGDENGTERVRMWKEEERDFKQRFPEISHFL